MAELKINPMMGTIDRVFKNGTVRHNIGHIRQDGYRGVKIDDRYELTHRVIFKEFHGFIPDNHQIDHIDGDKTNNRISNLRAVTQQENSENQHNPHKDGMSGHKGVSFHKASGRWQAAIMNRGKQIYLGLYESSEKAANAYAEAAALIHTHNPYAKKKP